MNSETGFLDYSVAKMISYFTSMMINFGELATKIGVIVGICGLVWTALRLVNSRATVRDVWWGTISKWTLYLLLMSLYSSGIRFIPVVANELGSKIGNAEDYIEECLHNLQDDLNNMLTRASWKDAASLETELENMLKIKIPSWDPQKDGEYSEWWRDVYSQVNNNNKKGKFNAEQYKEAVQALEKYKRLSNETLLQTANNINRIRNILEPIKVYKQNENTKQWNLVNSYFPSELWLKQLDMKGKVVGVSPWISPEALIRIGMFCASFMWDKADDVREQQLLELEGDQIKGIFSEQERFIKSQGVNIEWLVNKFTCMCMAVVLLCSLTFAMIQYVMTIVEFQVIAALGAFLIPFVLFDGTHDMPKKLVPVFMGFFFKILVITLCIFFVFWLLLTYTIDEIGNTGGINVSWIARGLFYSVMMFVLTQNAPKIAQTLMTGQPQLSMGEFVQAAVTPVAAAGMAKRGINNAKAGASAAKEGIRKGTQGAATAIGSIGKAAAAAQAGYQMTKSGKYKGNATGNAIKAAGASFSGDITTGVRQKMSNFAHGGKGVAGGGGNGSGGAFIQNGINTDKGAFTTILSTNSNASFKDARTTDRKTNQSRQMSMKEYMQEKREQGLYAAMNALNKNANWVALPMPVSEQKTDRS